MHLYEEQSLENAPADESGMPISPIIRLHPLDDVVIARRQLVSGARIPEENLVVAGLIPPGHKVATRPIAAGQPVRRYNQIIGVATQNIEVGQHVHTHNLAMAEFSRDYAFCVDAKPTEPVAEPEQSIDPEPAEPEGNKVLKLFQAVGRKENEQ